MVTKAPPTPSPLKLGQQQLLRPMMAAAASEPFDSAEHIFEIKWGGVRALAFIDGGLVTLIGSGGRDISEWYPELASLPAQVKGGRAVLDGEIVAVGKEGYPNLELLRERFKAFGMSPPPRVPEENVAGAVSYQVYDILSAGDRPLLDQPLWQRKKILHSILTPSTVSAATDFIDGEGVAFYQAALEHRLEGVVAKHKQSEYRPGERSSEWLDLAVLRSGDFIIGGYSFGGRQKPTGRRRPKLKPLYELLVGAYDAARSPWPRPVRSWAS
jgi:bifunctional non-homologous end joining protein LigD